MLAAIGALVSFTCMVATWTVVIKAVRKAKQEKDNQDQQSGGGLGG